MMMTDYSLEMTAKDVESLHAARSLIPAGTQISVTFLPGEDLDARVAAARTVRELGFEPMPHISARRLGSEMELRTFLTRLRDEAAVDRAFVVAGDPPEPLGPYEDALSVIRADLLAEYGIQKVGISGYPEGHPDISNEKLFAALRDKQSALQALGHDFEIITQFGFDADPVFDYLTIIRQAGVGAAVRLGVPGPTSVKALLRFAARCGVGTSAKVMKKFGMSITQLLTTATPDRYVDEIAARLDPAEHGEVKIHLYPFGGLQKCAEWAQGNGSNSASINKPVFA